MIRTGVKVSLVDGDGTTLCRLSVLGGLSEQSTSMPDKPPSTDNLQIETIILAEPGHWHTRQHCDMHTSMSAWLR